MLETVDMMMITQLNQIFKEKNIKCTLHSAGGCASCGMEVKKDDDVHIDDIVAIVNEALRDKFLIAVYQKTQPDMLYIDSKFGR